MKIKYEDINFKSKAREQIRLANEIIEEYTADGFSLTLRQLYYQFVARGLLANTPLEYNRLGVTVSNARRAGLIDWDAIVDRTREIQSLANWEAPADIIKGAAQQFRFDLWDNQDTYVEVWFEKDALMGVFERPANLWRVPFFSCRGYVSDSSAWGAAMRIKEKIRTKRRVTVLHFGDHDPSGIDMTRDIKDRLALFGAYPVVRRIALNLDQVKQYSPPPNPAKETDSRFADYLANYGDESWELDALEPRILAKLFEEEVKGEINQAKFTRRRLDEQDARKELTLISDNYQKVVARLNKTKRTK
jgi:hypothetical protein